jgi:hypothetical protein
MESQNDAIRLQDLALPKSKWPVVACASVAYFCFMFFAFCCWVHYFYAGNFSGPLMISEMFGVSEVSRQAGAQPIYDEITPGWDGQFYYTQSNDPFLVDSIKRPSLFDLVSYRYQRNGLPILAWGFGKITLHSFTTPFIYFATSIGIVSIAFGMLLDYLRNLNRPVWWALAWGFYGGVVRPMIHGLPDAVADSFLLASILAVCRKQVLSYSVYASLLCLCRESYAAPASIVWLFSTLNFYKWDASDTRIRTMFATAMPGIIVVAWAGFVAERTQTSFLSGSRSIPWGGLVDFPFFAYIRSVSEKLGTLKLDRNFFFSTSCAVVLFSVLWRLFQYAHRTPIVIALIVHVVLMTMTGWIVWEAGVGYFKNTSSVILIGVMLLAVHPSRILSCVLAASVGLSILYVIRDDFQKLAFLPPRESQVVTADNSKLPLTVVPLEKPLDTDFQIETAELREPTESYRGLFTFVHRSPRVLTIKITNQSKIRWPATLPGDGALSIAYRVSNRRRVFHEGRIPMYREVSPGDSIEARIAVPSPALFERKQTVRVSLIQDGYAWLDEALGKTPFEIENSK